MAEKPITFGDMFEDKFLKGSDLAGQEVVVKISAVQLEELDGIKGKRIAGIISLEGKKKRLPLNKTNALAIKGMFGPIATTWVGKRLQLYVTRVEVDHELHDAIRVRGSPDIAATIEFSCRLGRKNGVKFKLWKTAEPGSKAAVRPADAPAPQPPVKPIESEADIPTGVDDSGAPWNGVVPEGAGA